VFTECCLSDNVYSVLCVEWDIKLNSLNQSKWQLEYIRNYIC